MLLNPRHIPGILWMVAIIVPVSIVAEIFFTSTAAFFSGFSAKNAFNIGSSTVARGEYSLIYATLGFGMGAISEQFYQFAGVYVFLMTMVAPLAMKNSGHLYRLFSKAVPPFMKYNMKLVSLTMRPILLPEESGLKINRKFIFIGIFALYMMIVVCAFIARRLTILIPLCLLGLLVVYQLRRLFISKIKKTEEQFNYHEIHNGPYDLDRIARSIANIFSGLLAIIILGASFWNFGPPILIVLLALFFMYLLGISIHIYRVSQTTKSG
jgi:hypothetical protein